MRRPGCNALRRPQTRIAPVRVEDRRLRQRQRFRGLLSGHHVDGKPVRIGQPYTFAPARRVGRIDTQPLGPCQLLKIALIRRIKTEPHKTGLSLMRHMAEGRRPRSAHMERIVRPLGLMQAEVFQKRRHTIEIGRGKPHIGDIRRLDDAAHGILLNRLFSTRSRLLAEHGKMGNIEGTLQNVVDLRR